jgi:NAD(P)-dependent dehydrogenase (short-subunit alcohol dehydrogenase family)
MKVESTSIFSLEGKVAIVTGAAGLLGKEQCRALARAGATVIACDLILTENYWGNENIKHSIYAFDVTNYEEVKNAAEKIHSEFG